MADIKPTPPVNPLLGQAHGPPTLLQTVAMPVQLLDLPLALQSVQQQINLTGVLQLADANQLALNTALGQILFSLPQLRMHPQLLLQLLPFIESGKSAQLHIAPAPDGVLHGSLTLSSTTTTSTMPPHSAQTPNQTSIIGKQIAALILPQNFGDQYSVWASNLSSPMSQNSGPSAPALSKLSQQFLQILTGAATPENPSAAAAMTTAAIIPQLNRSQGFNVGVQKIIAPGQPPPDIAADEFIATVTGFSVALQQPVALAGNTPMMLKTGVNLPVGSMVVLKLPQAPQSEALEIPDGSGQTWPALQQLVTLAQNSEATPLQNLLQNRLPQMNQALGGAMLFMLTAFNRGDVRQWLGPNAVETLERVGKKNLVAALQDELSIHTATTADTTVGQWRIYHLPFLAQNQLFPMQIHVHHDGTGKDGETPQPTARKTRFVIDVTFTRLGAMQLDGFVQKKKFDLMLRSSQTLDPALRHELRYAFTDAVGAVGYTGQLLFQQGSQGWMRFTQGKHEEYQV